MVDVDDEVKNAKFMLFAFVAFLFSGYYSYVEMKYAIWGSDADATIVSIKETSVMRRRGRREPKLSVEYSFSDSEGQTHTAKENVPIDWEPAGETVPIEFIQGAEVRSRIAGQTSLFMVWVFLACLLWLGFSLFKLIKEANA